MAIGIGLEPGGQRARRLSDCLPQDVVVELFQGPKGLIEALAEGRIDAAVRGSLPAKRTLGELKKVFALERLARGVVMEVGRGHEVVLYPVGTDEGWGAEDRVEGAALAVPLARRLGLGGGIAVLSGGRGEDLGRSKELDNVIASSREVAETLVEMGLDAVVAGVGIESLGPEVGVVVPTDPISGNMIFRALHLVAGMGSRGAPVMNLDRPFVDTSRARKDYLVPVLLAAQLAGWKGHS